MGVDVMNTADEAHEASKVITTVIQHAIQRALNSPEIARTINCICSVNGVTSLEVSREKSLRVRVKVSPKGVEPVTWPGLSYDFIKPSIG